MKEALLKALKTLQSRFRVAPRYQPEKHYMRGPGPACAAKLTRAPESR